MTKIQFDNFKRFGVVFETEDEAEAIKDVLQSYKPATVKCKRAIKNVLEIFEAEGV